MKKEPKKKLKELTKVAIKSEDDDSIIKAILELEKFKEYGESVFGIESTSDYEPSMAVNSLEISHFIPFQSDPHKEIDEAYEYTGRLQEKLIWKLSPSALLAFHKRFEELDNRPVKSLAGFMARGSFLDLRARLTKRMAVLMARGLLREK